MLCIKPQWQTAVLGFIVLIFSMGVGRFAFTPLLPVMQAEGLLSVSSGGTLASVHFLGYGMGALLARYLSASPNGSLLVSLILIGFATLVMGLTADYLMWLVARWAAGVCSAILLVVVSTYLVRRLADAGRDDLQGMIFSGVGGGIALVGLVMLGFMVTGSPSDHAWLFFGITTLIAAGLIYRPLGAQLLNSKRDSLLAYTANSRQSWQIILPYGAMGAGYIIPATYLPVMAQETIASPLVFGWSWPIFGIAAAISTLLSARLHKAYSNLQIWITSQAIMAVGLILPVLWSNIIAVVIGGICVGGTFMVITMAGMKEAHRIAAPGHEQFLIATMTASFAFGQIIGPILAGWVYDASGSFSYTLLVGSAVLVLTLIPVLINTHKRG